MSTPPVPKYTLTVTITANSQDELEDRVQGLAINWHHHYSEFGSRDEIDRTDGVTSIRLKHTNPEQTPEAYREALFAWADARGTRRREAP